MKVIIYFLSLLWLMPAVNTEDQTALTEVEIQMILTGITTGGQMWGS